jgi:hypothetical protein
MSVGQVSGTDCDCGRKVFDALKERSQSSLTYSRYERHSINGRDEVSRDQGMARFSIHMYKGGIGV